MYMKSKPTISQIAIILAKKKYFLLTNKYVGLKAKVKVCCCNGHIWSVTLKTIVKRNGCICPQCKIPKGYSCNAQFRINKLETIRQIAQERGGKCLSTEYVNNHTKLEFSCKNFL